MYYAEKELRGFLCMLLDLDAVSGGFCWTALVEHQ